MMRLLSLFFAVIFSCLFCLHAVAEAPVVDDSENFAILDEQQAAIEQPVAKAQLDYDDNDDEIALAQDNDTGRRTNTDLLDRLKGMQQEIQELRGQLEIQAHELKLLQQQQLAFYKDLDKRLSHADSHSLKINAPPLAINEQTAIKAHTSSSPTNVALAPTTAFVTPPSPNRTNPADEQISYLAAYDLVKTKRFNEALIAMQNFVLTYPKGGYTANAHYWLGELYMVQKNYPEAIEHFDIVLKQFPNSSKSAASSLKIGYALAASGKKNEAKQRLEQVLRNYPDTPTAQLAMTKLKTLNAS